MQTYSFDSLFNMTFIVSLIHLIMEIVNFTSSIVHCTWRCLSFVARRRLHVGYYPIHYCKALSGVNLSVGDPCLISRCSQRD